MVKTLIQKYNWSLICSHQVCIFQRVCKFAQAQNVVHTTLMLFEMINRDLMTSSGEQQYSRMLPTLLLQLQHRDFQSDWTDFSKTHKRRGIFGCFNFNHIINNSISNMRDSAPSSPELDTVSGVLQHRDGNLVPTA